MGRDKEGKGGKGGEGREKRVWQRLVMGVGAGRVRGGCGYWQGSRQAGAAGQIPPQRIRSGRAVPGRARQGPLGGACKGVWVWVWGVVPARAPPPTGWIAYLTSNLKVLDIQ